MLKQLKQSHTFTLLLLAFTHASQLLSMNAEAQVDAEIKINIAKQKEIENSYKTMLHVLECTYQQIDEDVENPKMSLEGLESRLEHLIKKLDKFVPAAEALDLSTVVKSAKALKEDAEKALLYVQERLLELDEASQNG
jgi:hypothetical protein